MTNDKPTGDVVERDSELYDAAMCYFMEHGYQSSTEADLQDVVDVAAAFAAAHGEAVRREERERLKQEADLAGYAGLVAGLEWGKHK